MTVSSTALIRFITVGLVLVVGNVLYINWVMLSKPGSTLESNCESTKAHLSLRAYKDSSYTRGIGTVKWEADSSSLGMRLGANGTRIIADVEGHYVVFVQAMFFLNKTAVELSEPDGVIGLRLQLNTNDSSAVGGGSPESELVAAWKELAVKELREEQVARLSFMAQVKLRRQQYVLVKAKHLDKLNYDEPVSTTLSIFRYADLQQDTTGSTACPNCPSCCEPARR